MITEIRLPGINGLQLILKLNAEGWSTTFILLSGYGDFEYTKQLMNDYERNNLEDITAVLAEILDELKKELQKENVHSRLDKEQAATKSSEMKDVQNAATRMDKRTSASTIAKRMIELVRHHYTEEKMSLLWIAKNKFFMNADYLGKLFHKETGQYFSRYVMRFRIEKAIEYMNVNEELKNNKLALLTGFGTNPQYFIKVFKRITGITPGEYRKL